MIETSLMVYDYPEPPEPKTKVYTFHCLCNVDITVTAEDEETARSYCNLKECDDYEIIDVEEIIDYEIED